MSESKKKSMSKAQKDDLIECVVVLLLIGVAALLLFGCGSGEAPVTVQASVNGTDRGERVADAYRALYWLAITKQDSGDPLPVSPGFPAAWDPSEVDACRRMWTHLSFDSAEAADAYMVALDVLRLQFPWREFPWSWLGGGE